MTKRTTKKAEQKVERKIAGHAIALVAGKRYTASRPMAARGMKTFDVSICEGYLDLHVRPVVVIPALSYDAANELINAFNNGEMSFDGRIW